MKKILCLLGLISCASGAFATDYYWTMQLDTKDNAFPKSLHVDTMKSHKIMISVDVINGNNSFPYTQTAFNVDGNDKMQSFCSGQKCTQHPDAVNRSSSDFAFLSVFNGYDGYSIYPRVHYFYTKTDDGHNYEAIDLCSHAVMKDGQIVQDTNPIFDVVASPDIQFHIINGKCLALTEPSSLSHVAGTRVKFW